MLDMIRTAWMRLRATFSAGRIDRDFDDELGSHLEMLTDDLRRSGMSEADARREAARRLGRTDPIREDHRTARGLPTLDILVQGVQHSVRRLARAPVFTTVVVLTLALGIGANTALFSLIDSLLLRSLPVRGADRLVQPQVFGNGERNKPWAERFSREQFAAVRAQSRMVEDLVGFDFLDRATIEVDGAVEPERAVDWVSPNFFRALGVQPVIGRSADTLDGPVAVISSRWWRARFGASAAVLGRALTVDGKTFTIIGVAPPRFHGFDIDRSTDVWISPVPEVHSLGGEPIRGLQMVIRLQPEVGNARAEGALHPLLTTQFDARTLVRERLETVVRPMGQGQSDVRERYRGALWALMALVTLVLLTTCTNVGNLVMLRNTARRRELSLRSALGAGRSRLLAHSFVETALLAMAGSLGGLLFASWGVSIVVAMLPLPAPPGSLEFHADSRVLLFAAAICLSSALLFGLAPAWRAAQVDVAGALQTGFGSTAPRRARYLGRALVSAQVAFSVLLLVGAGLFVQTLRNLSKLNMGYSTERIIEVQLDSRFAGYDAKDTPAIDQLLRERIGSVTGVRSVTRTQHRMFQGATLGIGFPIEGVEHFGLWDGVEIGPRFFETLGIPVVRGRALRDEEFAPSRDWREPKDAASRQERMDHWRRIGPYVVNEAFAKHFTPGFDPVGESSAIVGVVKDVKIFSVKDSVKPMIFIPTRRPGRLTAMQVRLAGDVNVTNAVRQAVMDVNPRLFAGMTTLGEASGRSIAKERMVASVSGFFSVLGLMLAAMGIFGVASTAVTQRLKELGIRRALGAGQWVLVSDSLKETLTVTGLGLIVGALGAIAAVRVTANLTNELLFGLTATDTANLLISVSVMVLVGIAACALPAYRATRVDPLLSIRQD